MGGRSEGRGEGLMQRKTHDTADTELAHGFTIRDYVTARDSQPPDQAAIAEAIHCRFTSRYVDPVRGRRRHGFTIMAVSCLTIEALESFRKGWESTRGKSCEAFASFFKAFDQFKAFADCSGDFYTHVRCGILHQGETTGGWRIRRDGSPLLDRDARTINADCFLESLGNVLDAFCNSLKQSDWNGSDWANVRKKLDTIVENCE